MVLEKSEEGSLINGNFPVDKQEGCVLLQAVGEPIQVRTKLDVIKT